MADKPIKRYSSLVAGATRLMDWGISRERSEIFAASPTVREGR